MKGRTVAETSGSQMEENSGHLGGGTSVKAQLAPLQEARTPFPGEEVLELACAQVL